MHFLQPICVDERESQAAGVFAWHVQCMHHSKVRGSAKRTADGGAVPGKTHGPMQPNVGSTAAGIIPNVIHYPYPMWPFYLSHTTQKCGTLSKPDGVILNQFLIETAEIGADDAQGAETEAKIIKCSSCTDDANATSWCVECAEYICDSCVQAHQRLKITKDHSIKSKEEAMLDDQPTADEKTLMCQQHTQVSWVCGATEVQRSYHFPAFLMRNQLPHVAFFDLYSALICICLHFVALFCIVWQFVPFLCIFCLPLAILQFLRDFWPFFVHSFALFCILLHCFALFCISCAHRFSRYSRRNCPCSARHATS